MELLRILHLLAMAFFVGGQIILAAAIVPVLRGETLRPQLLQIARRFGSGSLVALAVLVVTGSWMAGDLGRWDDGTLHVKLGVVGFVVALVVWHVVRPRRPVIDVLILLGSLTIVALGVSLAH
jgi:uncharacterized membrane protein